MPEDFQQTVDLRDRTEKRRSSPPVKKAPAPIEKIYQDEEPIEPIKNLQRISRPKIGLLRRSFSEASQSRDGLIRLIIFILAILVVSATVYFLFFREKSLGPVTLARDWYAIKLVDGEIFYGQIADIKADPIFIANVYYNYDQTKGTAAVKDQTKTVAEIGSLILVKRGKETHGPDGSMNVVRSQVLFMEPLKADSKVLQAILQYEK